MTAQKHKWWKHNVQLLWNLSLNANVPLFLSILVVNKLLCGKEKRRKITMKDQHLRRAFSNPVRVWQGMDPDLKNIAYLSHSAILAMSREWNYPLGWRAFIGCSSVGKRFASSCYVCGRKRRPCCERRGHEGDLITQEKDLSEGFWHFTARLSCILMTPLTREQ